jgi:uncharacterized membrane protein YdjX (TVP38/TMEM64 family)
VRATPPAFGWRRALLGVALAAAALGLVWSDAGHGVLLRALAAVQGVATDHPAWAATLVVLLAAAAAILAFFSSWIIVPFAVYTWGLAGALLLVWGGWLVGGAVSYAIGRFLGPQVVHWLGFGPVLARYERRVSRHMSFPLAFLFQLAMPSEVRGYLLGLIRYAFAPYLLSYALAELPYGIAAVFVGAGLLERRALPVVTVSAALLLLTVWAFYALHRRMAVESAPPEPP